MANEKDNQGESPPAPNVSEADVRNTMSRATSESARRFGPSGPVVQPDGPLLTEGATRERIENGFGPFDLTPAELAERQIGEDEVCAMPLDTRGEAWRGFTGANPLYTFMENLRRQGVPCRTLKVNGQDDGVGDNTRVVLPRAYAEEVARQEIAARKELEKRWRVHEADQQLTNPEDENFDTSNPAALAKIGEITQQNRLAMREVLARSPTRGKTNLNWLFNNYTTPDEMATLQYRLRTKNRDPEQHHRMMERAQARNAAKAQYSLGGDNRLWDEKTGRLKTKPQAAK